MRKNRFLFAVALVAFAAFSIFVYAGDDKEKSATVEGTLVDVTCYAKGGFLTNDHGDMKKCGTMCAQGGLPVGVVGKDDKVTILAAPAPGYGEYVGMEVRITGTRGNHETGAVIPEKLEVKEDGKWVAKKLPGSMM